MPPEHEARSRAFYDHEQDEPRGRRRRTVADWGVSEDVFDRMPGPRFSRRGEEPRRREEAPRARFVRDEEPRKGDEWLDDVVHEDEPTSRTIVIEREPELDAELLPEAPDDDASRDGMPLREEYEPRGHVAPNGRRTFVIGGHPDRMPLARNRPPRTAIERIGPRPDRIVGYAVAMGVVLILIAILTSS
jgi:hypothetical protein